MQQSLSGNWWSSFSLSTATVKAAPCMREMMFWFHACFLGCLASKKELTQLEVKLKPPVGSCLWSLWCCHQPVAGRNQSSQTTLRILGQGPTAARERGGCLYLRLLPPHVRTSTHTQLYTGVQLEGLSTVRVSHLMPDVPWTPPLVVCPWLQTTGFPMTGQAVRNR